MYIAFNAPHDPRQAPEEYVDMYPTEKIKMPPSFLPEYPWKDAIGCSAKLRDEKLAPFPRTKNAVQVNRREYYAIITHMDAQIGRILDHLEATGQADNTYIFFTADHGLSVGHPASSGNSRSSSTACACPSLPPGRHPRGQTQRRDDLLPGRHATSRLGLAGAEKPDHVQFQDIMGILKDTRRGTSTLSPARTSTCSAA